MEKAISTFLLIICCLTSSIKAQESIVDGHIVDDLGYPIENVVISIIDINTTTITNDKGYYKLSAPLNRTIKLFYQHISYQDSIIEISTKDKKRITLNLSMKATGEKLDIIDVTAKYDDGYTRVNPNLSFKLPSPSGGIESQIKMLPGVSSSNELSSQYNVRGGNYDENLVFVNGIQIYRPFLVRSGLQEGLSFVNSDLTNSVKFSAGGFEAKYGDKMSSVMDVEYKKPKRYAGSVSGSLLGASASIEGNVKDVFTFLVGVRYKSNAYLFNFMETKGDYKPNFFDTQMLLTWQATPKFSVSLLGNFSKNKYLFIPSNRKTITGSITNIKAFTVYFDGQEIDQYENYLGAATFQYQVNKKSLIKLIISSYYAKESETYDIESQYWLSDVEPNWNSEDGNMAEEVSVRGYGSYLEHARNSITTVVSAADLQGEHKLFNNLLSWGIKTQNERINDHIKEWTMYDSSGFTLPHISTIPGEIVPLNDPSRILTFGEFSNLLSYNQLNTIRFTGFIQDLWKIDGDSATRFFLNAGIRFHYWNYNNEFTASPRLSFIYKPRWEHDWEFSVKTGLYYQPPFYREMRNKFGILNSDIKSQRSYQIIFSSEYTFKWWRRPFKFTTEAYYKYLDHLISYSVDNLKIVYSGVNDAIGYATGIDFKLSGEFIEGLESWITLSLMKTAEDIIDDYTLDENGNKVEVGYIPRPTDQRFAVNLFFQDHIPYYPQVRVHLNFVFSSGLPYGAPDSERYLQTLRMPWYRRVDIGFSYLFLEQSRDRMKNKSKFLRSIKNAGVYLEVFNLLNTNNVSSYEWIKDITNINYPIPNYLTPRLINVKLLFEF